MKMKMNSVVKLCALTAAICAANVSYAAGAQTATVTIHATVAPTCSISATSLEFNNYDPTSTTDKLGTGTVTLTCVKGSQPTISLTAGLNPNGGQRRMINAVTSDFLNYDLFKPTAANPAIDLPNTACAGTENQPWGFSHVTALVSAVRFIQNENENLKIAISAEKDTHAARIRVAYEESV
jgi:spore coat protein U-like protein